MDQRSRIVNELVKLAAESGKTMGDSEANSLVSEAIALVNDKFCSEIFSHSSPVPEVGRLRIERIIEGWLGTKD